MVRYFVFWDRSELNSSGAEALESGNIIHRVKWLP